MVIALYFASTILLATQMAMIWRYGWRGLASATGAGLVLIFGGGALYRVWWDAHYGSALSRGLRLEEASGFGVLQLYLAGNLLLAALLLMLAMAVGALPRRGIRSQQTSNMDTTG